MERLSLEREQAAVAPTEICLFSASLTCHHAFGYFIVPIYTHPIAFCGVP
jgi:hypothetical protein